MWQTKGDSGTAQDLRVTWRGSRQVGRDDIYMIYFYFTQKKLGLKEGGREQTWDREWPERAQ